MDLDEKDIELLKELQKDCKQNLKALAYKLNMKITTVHDRIKKLEKTGVIKGYNAAIDGEKVGISVTAFVFIRFQYLYAGGKAPSQEETAKKIALLPGVEEVHIIPGEWDMLMKVKGKNIRQIGQFVLDKLRLIKGVERTLTSDVWITAKESPELDLNLLRMK